MIGANDALFYALGLISLTAVIQWTRRRITARAAMRYLAPIYVANMVEAVAVDAWPAAGLSLTVTLALLHRDVTAAGRRLIAWADRYTACDPMDFGRLYWRFPAVVGIYLAGTAYLWAAHPIRTRANVRSWRTAETT
ncbi:MAG: hypothetical protein HOY79_33730 [Streptomyces sp.]|nr:hypothetical protein [Streptomyces sp.]NUS11346.1 hypothetical protein [Streptomyces sp.]NUS23378.1 hypothetical protein [Streptomyces sp.]